MVVMMKTPRKLGKYWWRLCTLRKKRGGFLRVWWE